MTATHTAAPSKTADDASLELLSTAVRAATAYGRPDLTTRLGQLEARVRDPHVRVLVVGEFKQGKSSLVNALINARICPVDDDVATSVPTAVGYAAEPVAVALLPGEQEDDAPQREVVDIEQIAEYVSERGNPGNERNLWAFEVGIPRELLAGGLVLVDTPGVGGLGSAHSATTIGALPSADAVVLVSDASQEYSEPELHFLQMARELTPNVVCVLTKIDFYRHWRTIADLDRQHLADRGIDAPLLPTSATLRRRAIDSSDRDLNVESGYPELVRTLREHIVGDATRATRRQVAQAVDAVSAQLAQRFEAERAALSDPAKRTALLADLEQAKQRAEQLRSRAARWQQTLSDGVADLSADADHELRARSRRLIKRAEEGLTDVDPGEVWTQFEQWLYRATTDEIAAHYAMVTSRARELIVTVGAHFSEGQGDTGAIEVAAPLELLRQIDPASRVEADTTGAGGKALTAMRGSYGGMMMVGILGSIVGLGMINPVSLGFGAMLGRRALRDEQERSLKQRRAEARQAARTYLDEVAFVVGKDSRDTLRRLQRSLRDTFNDRAEELQRSTSEALQAAQQALQSDEKQRAGRLRDVEAELTRLRALSQRAATLAGGTQQPASSAEQTKGRP